MPTVSEQFKTYKDFASATLDDIYGSRLNKAYQVTVNHLESGVWINDTPQGGPITFHWQTLPWDAQLSPINAIVSGDFNHDGKIELILAQNHFTNQMETGLWRGNPGCHLEWENNHLITIPPLESGVFLPNDTKAMISLDLKNNGASWIIAAQNNDKILQFKTTATTTKE